MSQLRASLSPRSRGVVRVRLAGAIDETADLDSVLSEPKYDLVLDMRDVERMNSHGIRRWIPALEGLMSQVAVSIENIPYPVALHANATSDLFAGADVNSCLAPYFCTACDRSYSMIVWRSDLVESGGTAPSKYCHECDSIMEFDELGSYFRFFGIR